MIQTNVEGAFVKLSRWLVFVVETTSRIRIGCGIKRCHSCAGGIDETAWDDVAGRDGRSRGLTSSYGRGFGKTGRGVAFERPGNRGTGRSRSKSVRVRVVKLELAE